MWLIALLRRQAEEIATDPALRAYGAVLALLHVLAAFWIRQEGKLALLAPGAEAICWPLLPDCEWLRVLPPGELELATVLWGLGVAAAFARPRWAGRAYAGLCLLLQGADGSVRRASLRRHGEARTACDPILIHGIARNVCRARDAGQLDFADLDVHLRSRRASERELRTVVELADVCAKRPRYHPFRHDDWIHEAR